MRYYEFRDRHIIQTGKILEKKGKTFDQLCCFYQKKQLLFCGNMGTYAIVMVFFGPRTQLPFKIQVEEKNTSLRIKYVSLYYLVPQIIHQQQNVCKIQYAGYYLYHRLQ